MRTSNPALNEDLYEGKSPFPTAGSGKPMTVQGSINKTIAMAVILTVTAAATWYGIIAYQLGQFLYPLIIAGAIAGLITGFVIIFKKEWAPILAPVYSIFEGIFVGSISLYFESMFPGIVLQAVGLTFGVLFMMLGMYKTGMIKVTKRFMMGVAAATGAVFLVYLVSFVLSFFGVMVPFIHDSGPIGIGFSLVVVAIAAFNLVLDFHFIEKGAEYRAPKYMEWYTAFGLMVTLIWLYLELLRLLAKISRR